jgi:hypothetical protein
MLVVGLTINPARKSLCTEKLHTEGARGEHIAAVFDVNGLADGTIH